jgi:hypothetical protein
MAIRARGYGAPSSRSDAVTQLKDRLLVLNVRDPGAAGMPEFFRGMYGMQVKPALITVSVAASAPTHRLRSRRRSMLSKKRSSL